MPRYRLEVAARDTGRPDVVYIDARTDQQALEQANAAGWLVHTVVMDLDAPPGRKAARCVAPQGTTGVRVADMTPGQLSSAIAVGIVKGVLLLVLLCVVLAVVGALADKYLFERSDRQEVVMPDGHHEFR